MKITFCISGIIAAGLMILLLTGIAKADKSIRQGSVLYESAKLNEALTVFETGLETSPENTFLSFNAAQTAYALQEYEKAIEYYGRSADSIDKYLSLGNACFKLGETSADINMQLQYYAQAMQAYQDGISKYPRDIPLKYNYETVKEKIEEILKDMEQENDNQNDSGDNREDQDDSGSDDGQNQEQDDNSEDTREEQPQNSEQDEESDQDQNDGENGPQDADSREESAEELDQEAIERILQVLEGQEEESLKNNQEIVGGSEGKYVW